MRARAVLAAMAVALGCALPAPGDDVVITVHNLSDLDRVEEPVRLGVPAASAGRLTDASPPLRLLLTDDESEAADIAALLHELNGARQDVERKIFDEAVVLVEALTELPPIIACMSLRERCL